MAVIRPAKRFFKAHRRILIDIEGPVMLPKNLALFVRHEIQYIGFSKPPQLVGRDFFNKTQQKALSRIVYGGVLADMGQGRTHE